MSTPGPRAPSAALILGDGFLSGYLLALLDADALIALSRASHGRAPLPAGRSVQRLSCDVYSGVLPAQLDALRELRRIDVYCLLPPSALGERAPGIACSALFRALSRYPIGRVIVVSSTAVYGDDALRPVDADSATCATSARQQRLLALEDAWLASGFDVVIVRLAGLYGRGRVIGESTIAQRAMLPGDAAAWLNLVHGEDAARSLVEAAHHAPSGAIALISDGSPVQRVDYYAYLAARLGAPPPRFDGDATRRGGSRRCDPWPSWRALGCAPRYPGFRLGLREILGG